MSKPIARIVFAVLISLGIIAAAAPNVQARLGSMLRGAESNTAAYISADAQVMDGAAVGGRSRYFQSNDYYHDCNSDPTVDY